jgi:hypothetical protein
MVEWYPHVLVVSTLIPQGPDKTMNVVEFYYPEEIVDFEREFIEAERAAYMETAIEDDDIGERMDRGRKACWPKGATRSGRIRARWRTACSTSTSSIGGSCRRISKRADHLILRCFSGRPAQGAGAKTGAFLLPAFRLTTSYHMQSLWMIAASFLFACMGVCVKLAAETHSAVEITFYRSFISLILMFGAGSPARRAAGDAALALAGESGASSASRRCSPISTPSRCCRWRRQ